MIYSATDRGAKHNWYFLDWQQAVGLGQSLFLSTDKEQRLFLSASLPGKYEHCRSSICLWFNMLTIIILLLGFINSSCLPYLCVRFIWKSGKNKQPIVQTRCPEKQISISSKEHIPAYLELSPVESKQKLSNSAANDSLAQKGHTKHLSN